VPEVSAAVQRLGRAGVPVVTPVTVSSSAFRGEEEREMRFRAAMRGRGAVPGPGRGQIVTPFNVPAPPD
jgi:hypothetical protein